MIANLLIALIVLTIVATVVAVAVSKSTAVGGPVVDDSTARNRAWLAVELKEGRAVLTPGGYVHTRGFGYVTGPYGNGNF